MPNVINPDLNRHLILSNVMEHLRNPLLPVAAFSTVFQNVPLEGTDEMKIPYIGRQTNDVKDFDHATGYTRTGNTDAGVRTIKIDKHKYIDLSYTDTEKSRKPYLLTEDMLRKKAEGLAEEILTDILSVVTLANFPSAPTTAAAGAFFTDDVIDLRTQANKLGWAKANRSLILDHDYDGNLLKDPRLANYDYGANNSLSMGDVPRISGFNILPTEYIPDNGIGLVGMAVDTSAIGVGFAPIEPSRDFTGTRILMTDPDGSGLTLEYLSYYNNDKRTQVETINANYGFGFIEQEALIPILGA